MSSSLWNDKCWCYTTFWVLVVALAHLGQSLLWSSELGVHWVYPEGWGRVQYRLVFTSRLHGALYIIYLIIAAPRTIWIIELSKSLIWLLLLHGFLDLSSIFYDSDTVFWSISAHFESFSIIFWCSNCTWAQFRPISVVFPAFLLFLWY